ncbi:methyltransferase TYW3-domain-containing protein [Peziza echinospora]|nr:methyltransferase TYW3-domain-containing protein [Peziza echinospora]
MFERRKQVILEGLADSGPDASPKGSVDAEIIAMVNLLNQQEGVVTTSSCAGRISVFIEGNTVDSPLAGFGGKGSEGRWFYVSHQPVPVGTIPWSELGQAPAAGDADSQHVIGEDTRFIHFKFEPMILHVMTSTLDLAQKILKIALSSGFRESGIMNASIPPTVAIRSTGLALDSIIGFVDPKTSQPQKNVDDAYLNTLVQVSQMRFKENERRRILLYKRLEEGFGKQLGLENKPDWEDKMVRHERLKREGLLRKAEAERVKNSSRVNAGFAPESEDFLALHEGSPSFNTTPL